MRDFLTVTRVRRELGGDINEASETESDGLLRNSQIKRVIAKRWSNSSDVSYIRNSLTCKAFVLFSHKNCA